MLHLDQIIHPRSIMAAANMSPGDIGLSKTNSTNIQIGELSFEFLTAGLLI